MSSRLSFDRLRRIQQTLTRRVVERDPENIHAVGFAPLDTKPAAAALDVDGTFPVVAQFDVWQKRHRVPAAKRITPRESLRLLDRSTGRYDDIALATDVRQSGDVVPTGVPIRVPGQQAVAAVVVRWTSVQPVPPVPSNPDDAQASPWRWGVLTVSHLFAATGQGRAGQAARLQRKVTCGDGPRAVSGRVVARGRIPGGPDVALVETGLDRLWLSGFLPRVGLDEIATAREADLLAWTSRGTSGQLFADRRRLAWDWQTYYPSLHIEGLGRLQHIIRYGLKGSAGGPAAASAFGPGTSGAVLVAGGIPIGIQIAAMQPGYTIGYAQSFSASVSWLQDRLQASSLVIVRVVT
ncbi:hypothetical protein [Roseimaritima ulvae]|uniref:hypothetical protein n=1 Tax=Roseimaritima ulvae TaxID=980254 RepID=UPI000830A036|nr:hypothetical protein [Roseimaritima ulvae]